MTVAPAPPPPASGFELAGDDGQANIDGLAVGPCTVTAKSDGAVGTADAVILENQTTSVTLSLARTGPDPNKLDAPKKANRPDLKAHKVIIKAVDEAGKEIPNATLNVVGQFDKKKDREGDRMLELTVTTNAKGAATLFLIPRDYRIFATATGFDKASGNFPIADKTAKPLELKMKKSEIPVTSIELVISPPRQPNH